MKKRDRGQAPIPHHGSFMYGVCRGDLVQSHLHGHHCKVRHAGEIQADVDLHGLALGRALDHHADGFAHLSDLFGGWCASRLGHHDRGGQHASQIHRRGGNQVPTLRGIEHAAHAGVLAGGE